MEPWECMGPGARSRVLLGRSLLRYIAGVYKAAILGFLVSWAWLA